MPSAVTKPAARGEWRRRRRRAGREDEEDDVEAERRRRESAAGRCARVGGQKPDRLHVSACRRPPPPPPAVRIDSRRPCLPPVVCGGTQVRRATPIIIARPTGGRGVCARSSRAAIAHAGRHNLRMNRGSVGVDRRRQHGRWRWPLRLLERGFSVTCATSTRSARRWRSRDGAARCAERRGARRHAATRDRRRRRRGADRRRAVRQRRRGARRCAGRLRRALPDGRAGEHRGIGGAARGARHRLDRGADVGRPGARPRRHDEPDGRLPRRRLRAPRGAARGASPIRCSGSASAPATARAPSSSTTCSPRSISPARPRRWRWPSASASTRRARSTSSSARAARAGSAATACAAPLAGDVAPRAHTTLLAKDSAPRGGDGARPRATIRVLGRVAAAVFAAARRRRLGRAPTTPACSTCAALAALSGAAALRDFASAAQTAAVTSAVVAAAAEVARVQARLGRDRLDRLHQPPRRGRLAEVLEHHHADQKVPIGLARPWPMMSNAEPWIGSNIDGDAPLRVDVAGRRDAEAAGERGGEVAQDVGVQVGRDQRVERTRAVDHARRRRIDELLVPAHVGKLARDLGRDLVPHHHRVPLRVALGDDGEQLSRPRRASLNAKRRIRSTPARVIIETSVADLDRQAAVHAAADAGVFALAVLAHDHPVEVFACGSASAARRCRAGCASAARWRTGRGPGRSSGAGPTA